MLTNQGYAQPADCWSLGLLLYEMMLGRSPFAAAAAGGDQMKLYQLIIGAPADTTQLPPDAASIVDALLVKRPHERLACAPHTKEGNKEDAVKHRPFFEAIDWDALLQRQVHAPHVPAISDHASGRQTGRGSGRRSPPLKAEDEGLRRLEQIFADWSTSGLVDDGEMKPPPRTLPRRLGSGGSRLSSRLIGRRR